MATLVTQLLGGGLVQGVSQVINSIKGRNPEDAAKLQEILGRHNDLVVQTDADIQKAVIDSNTRLNEAASANIQAEAKANWYTACARPSIIWCWIVIMLYNYVLCGLIHRIPLTLPDMFWEVSGIVITGYVFTRTGEKLGSQLFGGAGGSVQLPFGIKANSSGDGK